MNSMEQNLAFLFGARNGYLTMSLLTLLFVAVQFFLTGAYSLDLFIVLILGQVMYWFSYVYYMRRLRGSRRPIFEEQPVRI